MPSKLKHLGLNLKFQLPILILSLGGILVSLYLVYQELVSTSEELKKLSLQAMHQEHTRLETSLYAALQSKADSLGRFVARTSRDAIITNDLVTLFDIQNEAKLDPEINYVMFVQPNGEPFMDDIRSNNKSALEVQYPIMSFEDTLGYVLVGMDNSILIYKKEENAQHLEQVIESFNLTSDQSIEAFFKRISVVISILILIFMVSIYFIFQKFVTRPIKTLVHHANQLGQGALHHTINLPSRDEFEELANAFNIMAQSLQISYGELSQRNIELGNANKIKDEFLANMSHELRTPLNAIIGYSELMGESLENEQNRADLNNIHQSALYLLSLINNILDISKIESGKSELCMESLDIDELISDINNMILPIAKKSGNRYQVSKEIIRQGFITDRTKIRQILFNLLSNALKFTEQGTVELRIHQESRHGNDWIVFEVQDTGIGLTSIQANKIFQPFTQADSSTTRRYGGTGLGLSICKQACAQLGGTVQVRSQLGVGSTFTVRLPLIFRQRDNHNHLISAA